MNIKKVGTIRFPKRIKTGGRVAGVPNKVTRTIKELAHPYGAEALGTLVEVMRDEETPPAARIAAAREVLDRGYGKPSAIVGKDDEDDLPVLDDPNPDV